MTGLIHDSLCVPATYSDMKSFKPEPGEVSPLHSSTSSKKDGSLKRDRESQELNDSEEDLLEDEDQVRPFRFFCQPSFVAFTLSSVKSNVFDFYFFHFPEQMKRRGREEDEEDEGEQEEGEDDGDSANGDES